MPAAATAHYELWCMHTDDVSADAIGKLQKFFDRVVRVPYIIHPTTRMRSRKQEQIYGGWIAKSFTKWNIFDDTVFPPGSTVMLMDADMIVTDLNATVAVAPVVPATPRNDLLDVFDLVNDDIDGAATFSSPWCRPFANTVMVSPYNYAHGDIADPADIQCGLNESIVAFASMVIARPNSAHFAMMLRILRTRPVYGHRGCVSGHDEQLLAELMLRARLRFRHIHPAYNWLVGKDAWRESLPARTLHYYNVKPWDKREVEWLDEREWWTLFDAAFA